MRNSLIDKSHDIKKLLEAILLNVHSTDSIQLHDGKSGLSLCLFEVANYLDDQLIEDKALHVLQEVLALWKKGRKLKPMEIGFVLLYLIENKLIEADFDDLFGEDTERIISTIRIFSPYSEQNLPFIPFLSLLWNVKKERMIRQLTVDILDGAALSLENQSIQMQESQLLPGIQKWQNSFEYYLRVSCLLNDYTIPLHLLEQYAILYWKGRISNHFGTGFYIEKLASENKELCSLGKRIQEYAAQNIYPDVLTLPQQINLLYVLRQKEPLYKNQIQQLEKNLFDCENSMYEQNITRMVPLNKSVIGYEAGISRLLLYWVYTYNLRTRQDSTRFQYIFI